MPYEALATAATPALIIYLLDISESMGAKMGGEPKVDIVSKMLKKVLPVTWDVFYNGEQIFSNKEGGALPTKKYTTVLY